MIVLLAGWLVTLVSQVFMPDSLIMFGVLTLLGSGMLFMTAVEPWFRRINPYVGVVFFFALFSGWGNAGGNMMNGYGGYNPYVQQGFDQASIMGGINNITSAVSNGFANAEISRANLAMALALRGKKVLLADCDFDMRCLDLMLGVENEIMYDLYDAAKGRVGVDRILLRDERSENLWFAAAPYKGGRDITAEEFSICLLRIPSPKNSALSAILIGSSSAV